MTIDKISWSVSKGDVLLAFLFMLNSNLSTIMQITLHLTKYAPVSSYFPEVLICTGTSRNTVYSTVLRHTVLVLLPETMPELVWHDGKCLRTCIYLFIFLTLHKFLTPAIFSHRWSSDTFDMAHHKCCSPGCHSCNIHRGNMRLREGWQAW